MLRVISIDAPIAMEYNTSNHEDMFRLRPFNSLRYLLKQVLQKNLFIDLEPLSESEVSNLDLVAILTMSDDYPVISLYCCDCELLVTHGIFIDMKALMHFLHSEIKYTTITHWSKVSTMQ